MTASDGEGQVLNKIRALFLLLLCLKLGAATLFAMPNVASADYAVHLIKAVTSQSSSGFKFNIDPTLEVDTRQHDRTPYMMRPPAQYSFTIGHGNDVRLTREARSGQTPRIDPPM